MKKLVSLAALLVGVVCLSADAEYPESITSTWKKFTVYYNAEMSNPDKVIGMSLSDSMAMSPTMSHKKAAWYYGRVNFLLGQYSADPTPKREEAALAAMRTFLEFSKSSETNKSAAK